MGDHIARSISSRSCCLPALKVQRSFKSKVHAKATTLHFMTGKIVGAAKSAFVQDSARTFNGT